MPRSLQAILSPRRQMCFSARATACHGKPLELTERGAQRKDTVDGCEILLGTTQENLVSEDSPANTNKRSGFNHGFKVVQDFATIHSMGADQYSVQPPVSAMGSFSHLAKMIHSVSWCPNQRHPLHFGPSDQSYGFNHGKWCLRGFRIHMFPHMYSTMVSGAKWISHPQHLSTLETPTPRALRPPTPPGPASSRPRPMLWSCQASPATWTRKPEMSDCAAR